MKYTSLGYTQHQMYGRAKVTNYVILWKNMTLTL